MITNDAENAEAIAEPHIACTERRMAAQPVALRIQDTSSLDFNGQDLDGFGPLQYEAQRGMFLHLTYVVTPNREPLSTIDLWRWAPEFRNGDGLRPEDILESDRWIEGYNRVAETAASLPLIRGGGLDRLLDECGTAELELACVEALGRGVPQANTGPSVIAAKTAVINQECSHTDMAEPAGGSR